MLAPADAALACRDRAIPGLATVLDPEALRERLREAMPTARIGALSTTYVRYKPATSCLVGFRVGENGEELTGYAKALAHGDEAKLAKVERRGRRTGGRRPGALVLDDALVGVCFFPHDPDLPAMAKVAVPSQRRELLRRMLPEHPELWEGTMTPLAYKPERRFVARLEGGEGDGAVLKLYRGDEAAFAAARSRARALRSRGALALPEPIGHSTRQHALALRWLPGRSLEAAIAEGSAGAHELAAVGAALAALHGQRGHRLAAPRPSVGAARLLAAAESVAAVADDLGEEATALGHRLARWLVRAPRGRLPLHGDLSIDQVLLTAEGGAALIDLDEAVLGDPASDLARFAADLRRRAIAGELTHERVDRLVAHLGQGYAAALPPYLAPPRPASLACHTAAWLVRLAPEPFRRREADWHGQIAAILATARGCLDAR